jgi:hypothetical protein
MSLFGPWRPRALLLKSARLRLAVAIAAMLTEWGRM